GWKIGKGHRDPRPWDTSHRIICEQAHANGPPEEGAQIAVVLVRADRLHCFPQRGKVMLDCERANLRERGGPPRDPYEPAQIRLINAERCRRAACDAS